MSLTFPISRHDELASAQSAVAVAQNSQATVSRSSGLGFALLIVMLALVSLGKMVLHDTLDPDLFWHLRVAQRIAAQPFPGPLVDDLSFASVRTPWTPYSWLAELGMKWIWDRGGLPTVIAVQALACAALVVFIALCAREMTIAAFGAPRLMAAAVATFVGGFLALPYLSFRPVTFTLMLLAATAWILQRDRRLGERTAAIWFLPALTVLLINFHFFAGFIPAYALLLTIGAWWERRTNRLQYPEATRRLRRYAILTVASAAACLATPMLRGMLQTVLHYQLNDVMVGSFAIAEMIPFYRASPLAPLAASFVVLIVVLAIVRREKLRAGEWMWLTFSLLLLLRLGRFSPVFGIFAAPSLAVVLPRLSDKLLSRRVALWLLAAALLVNAAQIAVGFPRPDTTLDQWLNRLKDDGGYPNAAADFVDAHIRPSTHRLINEFSWGGFLEWRMGDTYQMLLDGRTQLFTPEFSHAAYLQGEGSKRREFLAGITADAAILPAEHSEFRQDLLQLGWRQTYQDKHALVLIPPSKLIHGPTSQ